MKKIQFLTKDGFGTSWTIENSDDRIIAIRDDVMNQLRMIDAGSSKARFLYVTDDLILKVDNIKSIDVTNVEDEKEK